MAAEYERKADAVESSAFDTVLDKAHYLAPCRFVAQQGEDRESVGPKNTNGRVAPLETSPD